MNKHRGLPKWRNIYNTTFHSIRDYFDNEHSREVVTFLFFVALSFLFWIMQSLSEDINTKYRIPIKFSNVPENTIFTNEIPSHIIVHLRDEATVLLNYNLEGIPPFEINFKEYSNHRNAFFLAPEQIISQIKKNLKNTTLITSMSVDTIAVYYTQGVGKKVKVLPVGNISTQPQYIVNGKATTDIDSVLVYAPDYLLDEIERIETQSFDASDLTETWKDVVPLQSRQGVKIVPDKVEVTIPVEELTTKSLTIPISVENLPSQVILRTFPASVNVDCVIPISRFSQFTEKEVCATVDYKDTHNISSRLPIKITRSAAQVIKVVPDSVEYILEYQ